MKTKKTLHAFLTAIFLLGTIAISAQTKIYIHKTNGSADEYNIADIDSISFSAPTTVIKKAMFKGYVQKGPYVNGSSVNIIQLDKDLNQTGNVFSTQIIDNSGNFEQKNINFTSKFVELKADGYYYNEVKGENSTGTLALYALADITDYNSVNINILTHLERQRISYLIKNNGLSFSVAKKQARTEVLKIFKFALPENVATESLDITDDALLLAVSVILQGQLSTGDVSELLANISSDIRVDGKLDNPVLGSQLVNNAVYLDVDKVIANMKKKYNGLGISVSVSSTELKNYIDQFIQNCGFEQTLFITYPEKGKYGSNILHEKFTETIGGDGRFVYSVKAEIPAGNSSLKIIIKSAKTEQYICYPCNAYFSKEYKTCPKCGGTLYYYGDTNLGTMYPPGNNDNWLFEQESFVTNRPMIFTAFESGKSADASVTLWCDFIIEYYENGATTPTKVKEVKVIPAK